MHQVQDLTMTYAQRVEQKLHEAYSFRMPEDRPNILVESGNKYFKLVVDYGHQRSVHSFVDRMTGDVLKAASWKSPAKGARYNLVTGLEMLLNSVDPYGSYLYKK